MAYIYQFVLSTIQQEWLYQQMRQRGLSSATATAKVLLLEAAQDEDMVEVAIQLAEAMRRRK